MKLINLTKNDYKLVEDFCNKCSLLGWVNNSSLKSMKFDSTIDSGGGFFGILQDDNLVSVAGYHRLVEIGNNAWRIFFRSATLPNSNTNKGLHRGTGPRGRMYIDAFIQAIPSKELYVTTNITNNEFESITRYNKSLNIESRMKDSYINFVKEVELYNTKQSLWKLDVEKYLERSKQ